MAFKHLIYNSRLLFVVIYRVFNNLLRVYMSEILFQFIYFYLLVDRYNLTLYFYENTKDININLFFSNLRFLLGNLLLILYIF